MATREQLHQITVDEIKTIARRQITESGAQALSMNAIAHQMGMSGPAIYRYFLSREDLIQALKEDSASALHHALETARQERSQESPTEGIVRILLAYRRWAIDHPGEYTLIFNEQKGARRKRTGRRSARTKLETIFKPALQPIRELVEARSEGVPPDWVERFWVTFARLHGWICLEISSRLPAELVNPQEYYRAEILEMLEKLGL